MTARQLWAKLLSMNAFSERLKLLREARKLTQARLAQLIDVDPRVYNRWERSLATPQFEAVVKLADVLHVSLDELVGRTPPSSEIQLHNPELNRLYRRVDELPDQDQQALALVIDSFIRKARFNKVAQDS